MKTNHTTGTWMLNTELASFNGDSKAVKSIVTENKEVICLLGETEEKFYNAKLIAASPILLDACIEALEFIEDKTNGLVIDAKDSLRIAIAQATGKR